MLCMKNLFRVLKSSLSFFLERNPKVEKALKDSSRYIPKQYKSVVIISADFELAWAWRFDKLHLNPKQNSLFMAKKERENIPKLINLSEKYNIPITWGTVGHLFLDECKCDSGLPHSEIAQLPHFENEWWKFKEGDWFDADPCSNVKDAPEWYAPDLITKILNSKVNHEIGCHSFSHISCDDNICSPKILSSELEASQKAADRYDVKLESFIFPGHTMGNYKTIRELGYTSIRTNFINTLGYPKLHSDGLWEHKTTMELNFNPLFSNEKNIKRFKKIIDKSIANHQVCNFWFHPSFDDKNINIIYPEIYNYLNSKKDDIWITTMREYTNWLNSRIEIRH